MNNATEELLECLAEECAEVIKAKTKITRFGSTSERMQHLKEEITDVLAVVAMLYEEIGMDLKEEHELFEFGQKSMAKRYSFLNYKTKQKYEIL